MDYGFLLTAYQGLVGPVESVSISQSLELLGKGMVGIFVVMLLIYLIIVVLNKATSNKTNNKE